jgi:signal transduction histidine kinase
VTANDALLSRDSEVSRNSEAPQSEVPRKSDLTRTGEVATTLPRDHVVQGVTASPSWLARKGSERTAAWGKVLRTTAFKLTLAYLTVFALFAAFLLVYFAWNTRRLINEQIIETVDAEVQGLSDQYRQGGIRRLVFAIEARARRPGSNLYLLTTAAGEGVAGNVGSLATGILDNPGWAETVYRRVDEQDATDHHALVRVEQLPGGFHLLVGRDLEERERLYDVVLAAGRWSVAIVVVLGLAGGFFVSRRVLRRIDAMTQTTRTIMQGDLHERLPVAGTGDELDRLAVNLNAMLERIEALMHGLKEVSDNIAHDLKTPLTRLRNRCEEALRAAGSETAYREALGSTIEESEALIRTFNALLMIARAESGQARDDMIAFDAAEIVRGIGDLYEPLADDKGLTLRVEAASAAWVRGNRELISQALANLVDNAIKYGAADGIQPNGHPAEIVLKATDRGDRILLSVADSGPGIAQSDRGRVLERFVRLEQSRSEPGSGLGLSLASAIARLHGGELTLEDNHPGLVSVISLPRVAAPLPAPAA